MASSNTGIFSSLGQKTKRYLDEAKKKRDEEEALRESEKTHQRKEERRYFDEDTRQRAISHVKEKAHNIINSDAKLSKKIAAINEYYKDHTKPKGSNVTQELADRAYINHYRRDMRNEKLNAIKRAIAEEKTRKIVERNEKYKQLAVRNVMLKTQKEANKILMKARANYRRANNGKRTAF